MAKNRGTFEAYRNTIKTCRGCGRKYQSHTSDGDELCPQCYDLAGMENEHSDTSGEHYGDQARKTQCPFCQAAAHLLED